MLAPEHCRIAFGRHAEQPVELPPFGAVYFPFVEMGKISSADLFGPFECELFDLYWHGRNRWKRFLDCGANLGLHSIIAARCGYEVRAYEPDPDHFEKLADNIDVNDVEVEAYNAAIWTRDDVVRFCRVAANGTANHVEGVRNAYGDVHTIDVAAVDCRDEFEWADLVKLDVEGAEAKLLADLSGIDADFLVEITGRTNADAIFDATVNTPRRIYAQARGWAEVTDRSAMPANWRDGHIFISARGGPTV